MQRIETLGRRYTRCIHTVLQRKIRASTRRVQELMAALKKNSNWLAERRHAGRLEVGELFDALIFLRLDPVDFFAEALGRQQGRPQGAPPPAVAKALRRLATEKTSTARAATAAMQQQLEEIDNRGRYDDPATAVKEMEELLGEIPVAMRHGWNRQNRC